jgi:MFS transporter, DHA2 family, multidrug resistance protein
MSTVEYGTRRVAIVLGVMLASLLGRIDGTIVNVALPTIQGNVGATYDEATWVIIGYLMANVVVIPLTPWLAMRFGRRRAFVGAIAGFTVLSLFCATATSVQTLVLFRIVQGAFAGGIDSTANAVLTSTFPTKNMGMAQSIFSASAAAAPPVGLLLGGILTDSLSWQWCFLINVPLGAAAAVLLMVMLRDPDAAAGAPKRPSMDTVGVALLAVGPSLLVYFLSEGDRYDWFNDRNLVLSALIGALATAAFIIWELRGTRTPIVDLRIFKFRRVAVGAAILVGNAFVYLSSMVFLPQYAQEVLGYTPTQSGLLVLWRSLPATLCMPLAGSISASGRVDVRALIGGGFVLMAIAGYWQCLAMTPATNNAALLWPLMIAGVGNAFTFSPLFVAVIGGVPPSERPKAAAIVSVTLQFGGALATAVLISSLHVRTALHQSSLASDATLSRAVVADYVRHFGTGSLATVIEAQARALGYADVAFIIAVVALVSAPLVLFLGRPRAT